MLLPKNNKIEYISIGKRAQSSHELLLAISAYIVILATLTYFTMMKEKTAESYRLYEISKLKIDSFITFVDKLKYENISVVFDIQCKEKETLNFSLNSIYLNLTYKDPDISEYDTWMINRSIEKYYINEICISQCKNTRRKICISNGYEKCPGGGWYCAKTENASI